MARVETALTQLFGIRHPVILAGMNVAAGASLNCPRPLLSG